jgi:hypothetical protein
VSIVGLFEARFRLFPCPFPVGLGGIMPETWPRLDADRGNAIRIRPRGDEGCPGSSNFRNSNGRHRNYSRKLGDIQLRAGEAEHLPNLRSAIGLVRCHHASARAYGPGCLCHAGITSLAKAYKKQPDIDIGGSMSRSRQDRIVVDPAVAHTHAIDDGIAKRPAAVDDPAAQD